MHRTFVCVLLAGGLALAGGCSPYTPSIYKIKVRQGNHIDASQLSALRIGMSKREVQTVLGTPLVEDPFHPDRWDYYYSYKPGTYDAGEPERKRLTLYFRGDTLASIVGPQ